MDGYDFFVKFMKGLGIAILGCLIVLTGSLKFISRFTLDHYPVYTFHENGKKKKSGISNEKQVVFLLILNETT